jgi:L-ascorbate metabolism protein UlaG (beta-lactamase superfamily)
MSHLHGDHFDPLVERELDKTLRIVTTRQAAASLRAKGFQAPLGLSTWRSREFTKDGVRLRITAMPGKHGPSPVAALLPRVMGSLIEFATAGGPVGPRLYVTGDTLVHDRIREIPRRHGEIDLALLHLGGTRLMGVMLTMDADQGVRMMQIVQPRTAIPIHYNDYPVFKSPLADFQRAVAAAGLEPHVHYLHHGDTYTFDAAADG